MSSFFAMGGYAAFVWPCYALTAIGMVWLAVASIQRTSKAKARLAQLNTPKS